MRLLLVLVVGLLFVAGCVEEAVKETPQEQPIVEVEPDVAPEEIIIEIPVEDNEFEISTDDIESDLDLSGLEDIDEELEDINW